MENLGESIWEVNRSKIIDRKIVQITAPSGFGKSLMLSAAAKDLDAFYIGSSPTLFDGSIAENIFLSTPPNQSYFEFFPEVRFSMTEHIERINEVLSTGQKQRIAFLRSLRSTANYLLFDETLSGNQSPMIDSLLAFAIRNNKICKTEKNLVFVCHNYQSKMDCIEVVELC